MGVCLPAFGMRAGAGLGAAEASGGVRSGGDAVAMTGCLGCVDRWKRLRKSDFASLSKRLVRSYSVFSEGMLSCGSSSWNNDGYMYVCDIIICYFLFPVLYPYTTACRLYSRHRAFPHVCLSEHGICRISHSCVGISIHSERNPNVPLV